jgi:hypothetical protein
MRMVDSKEPTRDVRWVEKKDWKWVVCWVDKRVS